MLPIYLECNETLKVTVPQPNILSDQINLTFGRNMAVFISCISSNEGRIETAFRRASNTALQHHKQPETSITFTTPTGIF